MTIDPANLHEFACAAVERAQLQDWIRLGTSSAKIAFFEKMIRLVFLNGPLTPERLALRDST